MTRRYLQTLWIFTLCVLACFSQVDAGQPNVILIFADDQGYGDLSCFGSKKITGSLHSTAEVSNPFAFLGVEQYTTLSPGVWVN